MTTSRPVRRLAVVAALTALATLTVFTVGCGDDSSTPTDPTPTSPFTQIFASNITPKGTAARYFTATQSGTVTLTLDSLSQAVPMGMGIGFGREETKECFLNTVVTTVPGASTQVSAAVDPGFLCAKLYDLGNLSDQAAFSITLKFP